MVSVYGATLRLTLARLLFRLSLSLLVKADVGPPESGSDPGFFPLGSFPRPLTLLASSGEIC